MPVGCKNKQKTNDRSADNGAEKMPPKAELSIPAKERNH